MSHDDVHPHDMADELLDTFLDDLRRAAADVPAPVPTDELRMLFRDGAAPQPDPSLRSAPRPRKRLRIAVAALTAGVGLGGLGVAGALPAPVQRTVAQVVDHVGVELPRPKPAERRPAHPPTPLPRAHRPAATPVQPTAPDRQPEHGQPATRHEQGADHRVTREHGRARGRTTTSTTTITSTTATATTAVDHGNSAEHRQDGEHGKH